MEQLALRSCALLGMVVVSIGCGGSRYTTAEVGMGPGAPPAVVYDPGTPDGRHPPAAPPAHHAPAAEMAMTMEAEAMADEAPRQQVRAHRTEPSRNTEQYERAPETGFVSVHDEPLSTFSVDVDTASYSNVRRFLMHGQQPPPEAVRVEEMLNYFSYRDAEPRGDHPIAVTTELAESPFGRRTLVRIGIKARNLEQREDDRPRARNLVFLVDVSGSMQDRNKLPLLVRSLELLTEQLGENDRVSIVTYAGSSGVLLEPTRGDRSRRILDALHGLRAGGSTHGSAGIEDAYRMAERHRIRGGINRVILATDGDFNVGVTSRGGLERLIEEKRERGIFLTVLGFGMGNLKDATMEMLADKGNGNYAYIDTEREARKVLVQEMQATLDTVAKDTKIQVELNPARVARYRLIGYDNRRLENRDFNDDRRDAGDMGDGHSITALYELELRDGSGGDRAEVDPLRYQQDRRPRPSAKSDELMMVKIRYKRPDEDHSRLLSTPVTGRTERLSKASEDMRFATAVAGFGLVLRGSAHTGDVRLRDVERLAEGALGDDRNGYRRELVELVGRARELMGEYVEFAERRY